MADLNNLLGNLHDEEDGGEDEDEYNMRKKGQYYEDDEDDEIRNNKTYNTTDTQFYPDGITSVPTVYGQLKIAWNQELACPELMPYPQELMDYFLNLVATQEDVIAADTNRTIALDILKIELDRVKFILADLLRTRIHKIEKYALYNRNVLNRMSDDEVFKIDSAFYISSFYCGCYACFTLTSPPLRTLYSCTGQVSSGLWQITRTSFK